MREPNSARYWRLNSIIALRETARNQCQPLDPEEFAAMRKRSRELAELEAREAAVKVRAARRFRKLGPG
jgi:hypothetical protein